MVFLCIYVEELCTVIVVLNEQKKEKTACCRLSLRCQVKNAKCGANKLRSVKSQRAVAVDCKTRT